MFTVFIPCLAHLEKEPCLTSGCLQELSRDKYQCKKWYTRQPSIGLRPLKVFLRFSGNLTFLLITMFYLEPSQINYFLCQTFVQFDTILCFELSTVHTTSASLLLFTVTRMTVSTMFFPFLEA